jgi:6-methylsalicylate decarboxylase
MIHRSHANFPGILSITTPGAPIAGTGTEGRELARGLNEYLGNETVGSSRLGFFGALPDWRDVNGTLDEIDYLYQTQRLCNGVGVFSSYGNLLPGDPLFAPIWNRLNSYNALVFLHPTTLPGVEPAFIAGGLPQPIIDFPLATTRAAVDLVFTGTVTANPNLDIILSHAGGALPFLVNRAVGSLLVPEVAAVANVTVIQARRAFQRFYYDIALSTSSAQLDGLLDFTDASKILWGSDYPYAPEPAIDGLVLQYTAYVGTNRRGSYIAPHVLRKNAARLLQKHTLDKTFDFDKIQ